MARQNEYYFLNLSNIRADIWHNPPVYDLLRIPGRTPRSGRSGDKTGILCGLMFGEILRKRDLEKIFSLFPLFPLPLLSHAAVAMILESEKDLYCDHSGGWHKTVEYKFQYKKYK